MKKFFIKLTAVIFTVSAFLLAGFVSVIGTATSGAFYRWQFEKNNTLEYVRAQASYTADPAAKEYLSSLTDSGLEELMSHTMKYCLGAEDDLNPIINGERVEVFRPDEVSHMYDVKTVFKGGIAIGAVSAVLFISGLAAALVFKKSFYENCRKIPYITLAVMLGLIAVIGLAAAVDFDAAFELFHMILFEGNWTFGNGVMIAMIGAIFTDIVPVIITVWLILSAVFVAGTVLYNRYLVKKYGGKSGAL